MKKFNNWQRLSLSFMVCVLAAVAASLMGCGTPPVPRYPLVMTPAPSLDGSVTLDIVGITASEKGLWEGYSVEKYFTPGDSLRSDAVKITYKWTSQSKPEIRLEITDPVWDKWMSRGVTHLVVMADLPGKDDAAKRLVIPLDKKIIPGKLLPIEVSASRVVLLTAMKPTK